MQNIPLHKSHRFPCYAFGEPCLTYGHTDTCVSVKVDCTEERSVCAKNMIRGYPTLIYFSRGLRVNDGDVVCSVTAVCIISSLFSALTLLFEYYMQNSQCGKDRS